MIKLILVLFLFYLSACSSTSRTKQLKYQYLNECERHYMNLGVGYTNAMNRCKYRRIVDQSLNLIDRKNYDKYTGK